MLLKKAKGLFMFSKKAMSLLLAVALAVTSVMPVFAEEYVGANDNNDTVYEDSVNYCNITFRPDNPTWGDFGPNNSYAGKAWPSAFFKLSDGKYHYIATETNNEGYIFDFDLSDKSIWEYKEEFLSNIVAGYHEFTCSANEKNDYTIEVPDLKITKGGWKCVGWLDTDAKIQIPIGRYTFESKTFETSRIYFCPILEPATQSINEKFQTVSFN